MRTRLIGAVLALVLAVTGTVVLTGYVRGADARASAGAEFVSVYVVSTTVAAGTRAEDIAQFVTEKQVPALAAVSGRVKKLADLEGRVADVALLPGEQLLSARWVDPARLRARGDVALPAGMQAVTIALPVERVVAGTVKAGDTVGAVIATPPPDLRTKEVLHKILVLAVQPGTTTQPTGGKQADNEPVDTVMVTLALVTPDVEKLVWGQEYGSVWLTLEPREADESGSRVVDSEKVFQ
jgi:pilus assembly protein CpaB